MLRLSLEGRINAHLPLQRSTMRKPLSAGQWSFTEIIFISFFWMPFKWSWCCDTTREWLKSENRQNRLMNIVHTAPDCTACIGELVGVISRFSFNLLLIDWNPNVLRLTHWRAPRCQWAGCHVWHVQCGSHRNNNIAKWVESTELDLWAKRNEPQQITADEYN